MTIREAVAVSRVLDDGRGALDASQAGQGRVHELLSQEDAIQWHGAPEGLRGRVMARAALRGSTLERRGASVWMRLGIAACLVGAAGAAWVAAKAGHVQAAPEAIAQGAGPKAAPTAAAVVVASGPSAPSSPIDIGMIFSPLAQSDPAITATVEEPLLHEARMIRDDSKAGVEMVLSRLPMGESLWR